MRRTAKIGGAFAVALAMCAAACDVDRGDPTSSAPSSDSGVARDATGSAETSAPAAGGRGSGQGSGGASNGTGGVAGAGVTGMSGSDTEAGPGGSTGGSAEVV